MLTLRREIRNLKMDAIATLKASGYALLYTSIVWLPILLITSAVVSSFLQTIVITVLLASVIGGFLNVSYRMGTTNPIKWYVKWFGKSVLMIHVYGNDDDEDSYGDWLEKNLPVSTYHINPRTEPKMRRSGDGLYWDHYTEIKFMKAEDAVQFKMLFSK